MTWSGKAIIRKTTGTARALFVTSRLRLLAVPQILTEQGVALYGVCTMVVRAIRTRFRSGGELTGTGTLTAGPVRRRPRTGGLLTGLGTLTAAPTRRRNSTGGVLLGVGTLTAASTRAKPRALGLLGIGLLTVGDMKIEGGGGGADNVLELGSGTDFLDLGDGSSLLDLGT